MVTKYLPFPKSNFQEAPFITRLGEYIASGEYQCAVDLLLHEESISKLGANILGECLIQSTRQLCVAALQTQADIEHHRKSLDMTLLRRTQLDDEIRAFIRFIGIVFENEQQELAFVSPVSLSTAFPGVFGPLSSPSNTIVQFAKPTVGSNVVRTAGDALNEADYRLEVYTLGSFQVYFNDEMVENWSSRKGTHIFKYLLFNREHPIHKEVLMEQFWPDSDVEAQRNNLNVAIYGLRQVLRDNDSGFSHVLFQNDCYFLNPEMDIWLDADAFSKRYQAAQKFAKQNEMSVAVTEYAAAEMLYEGPFLPEDTYEEWTEALRQQLRMEYLDTLDQLSRHYLEAGDYAACASMCQKMLAMESCSEDAHARLMRCYRRQGQIHLALRQYDRCMKLLDVELDIEPSEEMKSLHEKLRAGENI